MLLIVMKWVVDLLPAACRLPLALRLSEELDLSAPTALIAQAVSRYSFGVLQMLCHLSFSQFQLERL